MLSQSKSIIVILKCDKKIVVGGLKKKDWRQGDYLSSAKVVSGNIKCTVC